MEILVVICLLVLIAVPVIILVQIAEIKKLFQEWINYQKRQSRKLEQRWSAPTHRNSIHRSTAHLSRHFLKETLRLPQH